MVKRYGIVYAHSMIDFETVLRLSQSELKEALRKELSEMGFVPISWKGFLYAPGQVPVLLVAHLDTVYSEPPEIICYSKDERYVMSPQGIGGDDRAGVYMILQILRQVNCYVLFCEDEECGGRSAAFFTRSGISVDVNYIVELDRKGENDAVYYGCDNQEFRGFVAEFGFQEAFGSFSDISILAPYLRTAAVNLSAGYYNAHRNHELIDREVIAVNTERVIEMAMTPTEHYHYRTKPVKQCKSTACKSLFDQEITDFTGDSRDRKFLMPLPEDTRLMVNGYELKLTKNYMIDCCGTVYIYSEDLKAAVESEMLIAYSTEGKEVSFFLSKAKQVQVVAYDDVIRKLLKKESANKKSRPK